MLNYAVDFCKLQASHLEPQGYRPEAVSYRSASLEIVRNLLQKKDKPKVLNLAPLTSGLFNLMAPLNPLLVSIDSETTSFSEQLCVIKSSSEQFDLVLLWDCLMYRTVSEQNQLLEVIQEHSTTGTNLMAYSTVRQELPQIPSFFKVDSDYTVSIIPRTSESICCQRSELFRSLSGWRNSHTLQLRNSFREHLIIRL